MRLTEVIKGHDRAPARTGGSPDVEVERSVQERLYRDRGEVTAMPTSCGPGLLGRLVGGRYRLIECLGDGGTATVYRARDERLERDVAVKLIAERAARDPLSVRRLRREAQLGARLAHPNIGVVLDVGTQPRDFIVMELVLGLDAATLLRTRGPLRPGEAVHIVAAICEALAHAHRRDVIHQDVSPANILIAEGGGTAKLADFGLASDAFEPAGRVRAVSGTPGYVAPEVLGGARPSPRSDLYSLGAVARRLLVGPSEGSSADPQATVSLASGVPRMAPLAEARPGLPRRLYDAVQQALDPDPDARQGSVAEFRAQLVDGHGAPLAVHRDSAPRGPEAVENGYRRAA